MKKIIAILLIASIAIYNFAHIAVYNIRQYYIKLESIKAINNAEEIPSAFIVVLKFCKSEMKPQFGFTFRDAREFTYNGNMYDIIYKSHESKDSVRFVCFFDLNETVLNNNYVQWSSDDPKNPPIREKNQIVQIELFCNQIIKIADGCFVPARYTRGEIDHYVSKTQKPAEPPPRNSSMS